MSRTVFHPPINRRHFLFFFSCTIHIVSTTQPAAAHFTSPTIYSQLTPMNTLEEKCRESVKVRGRSRSSTKYIYVKLNFCGIRKAAASPPIITTRRRKNGETQLAPGRVSHCPYTWLTPDSGEQMAPRKHACQTLSIRGVEEGGDAATMISSFGWRGETSLAD